MPIRYLGATGSRTFALTLCVAGWTTLGPLVANSAEPRRVGIIGCDTSHVIAFTDLLNATDAASPFSEFEVTTAYAGGSNDIPDSRDRVSGFVAELEKRGVTMVESIETLCDRVDAILLESVDGRPHLAQFRKAAFGKPVFIDKPMAGCLADALAIFAVADKTKTPCFSASALRFCDQVTALANNKSLGNVLGCETAGPFKLEPHHPDWFWYGIHSVEPLVTLLGAGCSSVSCSDADSAAILVATWSDGKLGTVRGLKRGKTDYFYTVFGERGVDRKQGFAGYRPLVRKICEFFVTGKPPVPRQETIEILAIMEAADESNRRGGMPVLLADVIERAECEASKRALLNP